MGYVCSLICFLSCLLIYSRDKRIYSPGVLFTSFWGILLFLSSLRLYGIHSASNLAYFIILSGVVFFSLGTCWGNNIKISKSYVYSFNKKIYILCVVVCLVSLILNFQIIYQYIIGGFSIDMIYMAMASTVDGAETEISSLYDTNLVRLQQYIGYPLLYAIVPVSIAEYVFTKKNEYIYIALFLILLRFVIDLRRTFIVIIVIFVLFLLLIKNVEQYKRIVRIPKLSRKKKIAILLTIILLAIGFSYFSKMRRGEIVEEEYSLASNFYYYYVGSIPYLSHRLDMLKDVEYTLGLTSFRGFFAPFFVVSGALGLESSLMDVATKNINDLHATVLLISKTHSFNSYATCFFEFYLDGGFVGVIIISFLFGMYAQKLFKQMVYFKNSRFIFKYSYFCSLYIYLSVLIFEAAIICYIWPFILERLMYRKQIVKNVS